MLEYVLVGLVVALVLAAVVVLFGWGMNLLADFGDWRGIFPLFAATCLLGAFIGAAVYASDQKQAKAVASRPAEK